MATSRPEPHCQSHPTSARLGLAQPEQEDQLKQWVHRLSVIEGHVRGIKTMVRKSRPCPDVLIQLAAIRGALEHVSRMMLDEHLTSGITRAATQGNAEVELAQLKAALDQFLP